MKRILFVPCFVFGVYIHTAAQSSPDTLGTAELEQIEANTIACKKSMDSCKVLLELYGKIAILLENETDKALKEKDDTQRNLLQYAIQRIRQELVIPVQGLLNRLNILAAERLWYTTRTMEITATRKR